ncbi:MAG: general stress protein CsbD [Bacteroidota bacterium]|nr:general stress protein CsbD [Bacteroidota bacterium]
MIPSSPIPNLWNEQKKLLLTKFRILTDQDLRFEEGKKEEMLYKLQLKLGLSKEEITILLKAL